MPIEPSVADSVAPAPAVKSVGSMITSLSSYGSSVSALRLQRRSYAFPESAARVMGHDVNDVKQLGMGYEMGLGEIREGSIELVGERLDDLRLEWRPAKLRPAAPPSARGGRRDGTHHRWA